MDINRADLVTLSLVGVILLLLLRLTNGMVYGHKYKLPPRVPGLPFFGNTFQYPLRNAEQAKWATDLAERYGEMFSLRLGTSDWVFLNSSRVVDEILNKRASMTSSKPYLPMLQGIMSANRRLLLMQYGERWRKVRKIMHGILHSTKMMNFSTYQDMESRQLLFNYLKNPHSWFTANQRYANAVIIGVVFGRRPGIDDPNVEPLITQTQEVIKAMQPGANLVDGFTFLAKLPQFLQWWRPRGERLLAEAIRVYRVEIDRITKLMEEGKAPQCFAVDFLKETEGSDMDPLQKLFVMGDLMEAGSDTSRIVLGQIIAAAVAYPDWVVRARQHLDRVCGSDAARLPNWGDKPQLQYISAVVKEGLRWRPMVTVGVPHVLTQDMEYEGYKFPTGTIFTWNAHYISLNPAEYEDPERFWPERFLNEDIDNVLKGHWTFGAGRRVCVGYNVGENNLWIAMARLLYCFEFLPVPGQPIDTFNTDWLEFRKASFPIRIQPRSSAHVRLIEESIKVVPS